MRYLCETILDVKLYIDPATTSYLIQIIAGVVVAGGAAFGIFYSKLRRLFKKGKQEEIKKDKVNSIKKTVTAEDLLDDEE